MENNFCGIFELANLRLSIYNNNIKANKYGVYLQARHYLQSFPNIVLRENVFINNGLYVLYSRDNIVENNVVNGKPLVYLEGVSNFAVTDAGQVIAVNSNNIQVKNLEISYTTVGIELFNTTNSQILNNHLKDNFIGISLEGYSTNNSILGNIFLNCGLLLYESGNVIENNTVNGKPLVYLEGVSNSAVTNAGQIILINCNDVRIENVDLSYATVGVILTNTNNTIISNNVITKNSFGGIFFLASSNNTISENNIKENGEGIILWDSSINRIIGNNVAYNKDESGIGIRLFRSSNNGIFSNRIAYNIWGIALLHSSYNFIFHNEFVKNLRQVKIVDSLNIWDFGYPTGGNYWSDYTGVDYFSGPYQNEPGSDGIGDTPYIIDESNQDRYPLINPNITIHDIAVVDIASKSVVGQGYSMNMNVTVVNLGDYTETFDVTLYADSGQPLNETGLVGYWSFDEGTGTVAHDSSGNNNHGTITEAAWTNGKIGNALQFDGIDDWVEVPHSESLNLINVGTITAWIKIPSSNPTYQGNIVNKAGGWNRRGWMLTTWEYNRIRFHWQAGADVILDSQTTLTYDQWHHITVIMDGTTMKIYIDGIQDPNTLSNTESADTTAPVTIGRSDIGYLPFNGVIDEVKIFNRALSAEEVWAEYTRTGAHYTIGTQTITLQSGESATLTFTWNTTGFAKGNYTIWAYAWPVPGEIDMTDNEFTDGVVTVAMQGDINADGIVDIYDCVKIAVAYSSAPNDPNWDPNADINNDKLIDIYDLVIIAIHYAETDP